MVELAPYEDSKDSTPRCQKQNQKKKREREQEQEQNQSEKQEVRTIEQPNQQASKRTKQINKLCTQGYIHITHKIVVLNTSCIS
jgi:hypothetical protein